MTRLRPPQHRSAVIGAQRTVQYYESVLDEFHSRRKIENTIRPFLAPGMDHCGAFESGLSSWDRLAPLVQWVEKGVAPDRIVAAQTAKGAVIRTRPDTQHVVSCLGYRASRPPLRFGGNLASGSIAK